MTNESDDRLSGVRTYLVTTPTGARQLTVSVVLAGEEILTLPGELVKWLRTLLQEVESAHPDLVGTIEARPERKVVFDGVNDPSKAHLN